MPDASSKLAENIRKMFLMQRMAILLHGNLVKNTFLYIHSKECKIKTNTENSAAAEGSLFSSETNLLIIK